MARRSASLQKITVTLTQTTAIVIPVCLSLVLTFLTHADHLVLLDVSFSEGFSTNTHCHLVALNTVLYRVHTNHYTTVLGREVNPKS